MIKDIRAYTILNSSLQPSVLVKLWTDKGACFSASVPSGTSKGSREAKEIPLEKMPKVFSVIRKGLISLDEEDWVNADLLLRKLDGTEDFGRIGANLSLAISLSIARAATGGQLWRLTGKNIRLDFPFPVCNIIGGGQHGGGTTWQEFLAIPSSAASPLEAFRSAADIWLAAGGQLKKKGVLTGRNKEGAWTSTLDDSETLNLLSELCGSFKLKTGIDFAASSFWDGKSYKYGSRKLTPEQQFELVLKAAEDYGLYYLEDPFHEDDFQNFSKLTKSLGRKALIVGDDLFTTNISRLRLGLKHSAANSIIIKPNQIGTVSQALEVAKLAKEKGMTIIPSHRSNETEDDWLSDICLALDAPLIKIGMADAPKMNRMLTLWEEAPEARMAKLPLCKPAGTRSNSP